VDLTLIALHNRIGSKPGSRVMTVEQILGRNGVADGLERLREKGLIRRTCWRASMRCMKISAACSSYADFIERSRSVRRTHTTR
jgi:hypothetical protein